MPIPEKYLAGFTENGTYHVYNRTNNKELLFLSDENRRFFLKRYKEILSAYIDTYAWCLLPNHFHLLIRVKPQEHILNYLSKKESHRQTLTEKKFIKNQCSISELIEQSFKRFFQSYAQSFNKMYNRSGNLFYKPFKRVLVNKETQFTQAVIYIHANPLKHNICKDFTTYKWSSWQTILSVGETDLLRDEIVYWFGNKERMAQAHEQQIRYYYDSEVSIEE